MKRTPGIHVPNDEEETWTPMMPDSDEAKVHAPDAPPRHEFVIRDGEPIAIRGHVRERSR